MWSERRKDFLWIERQCTGCTVYEGEEMYQWYCQAEVAQRGCWAALETVVPLEHRGILSIHQLLDGENGNDNQSKVTHSFDELPNDLSSYHVLRIPP